LREFVKVGASIHSGFYAVQQKARWRAAGWAADLGVNPMRQAVRNIGLRMEIRLKKCFFEIEGGCRKDKFF
jgi:hypothetical protein